jgi:DoxX-like protein
MDQRRQLHRRREEPPCGMSSRLFARLVLGGYTVVHGSQKLLGAFGGPGPEKAGAHFEAMGLNPGKEMAMLAGATELGAPSSPPPALPTPRADDDHGIHDRRGGLPPRQWTVGRLGRIQAGAHRSRPCSPGRRRRPGEVCDQPADPGQALRRRRCRGCGSGRDLRGAAPEGQAACAPCPRRGAGGGAVRWAAQWPARRRGAPRLRAADEPKSANSFSGQ